MDQDRQEGAEEANAPFYSTFQLRPVTDEEVLPLYEIYRRVSGGQTLEPFESLRKRQPEEAISTSEDEQAA
jgi:hypothetical protein